MTVVPAVEENSLILDTDIFSHWRNRQNYALEAISLYQIRLKRLPSLSSTTVFEALRGIELVVANRRGSEKEADSYRERIEQLCELCGVLPFDRKASGIAAYVCANLGDNLFRKHWRDVFITATAIAHNHGVATRNKKDFELIGNSLPTQYSLRLAIWKP